jgi:hypothetical protein
MLRLAGRDSYLGDFLDPDDPEAMEDLTVPERGHRATS